MLRKAVTLTAALLMLVAAVGNANAASSEQEKLVQILRTSNPSQINKYVPVVFDLEHVNPYAVVRYLQRVMETEDGGLYTFAAPDGNSGKVLFVAPEFQVDSLRRLVDTLDRPKLTSKSDTARVYLKLKHRSARDIDFLRTIAANGQFSNFLLVADPHTNALYIQDTPEAADDHIRFLAGDLDVPTAEVACDVTIYEINVNNDGALGLDFHAWKNGPGRNLFAAGAFAEYETLADPEEVLEGIDFGADKLFESGTNVEGIPLRRINNEGYNLAWYYQVPSAYFDYLNVKGMARLVTKARISVLNGHQGSISTGEQMLYYLAQNGPAPSAGTRPPGQLIDPFGESALRVAENRTVVGQIADRKVDSGVLVGERYDFSEEKKESVAYNVMAAESGVFLDVVPVIAQDMITMDLAYTVAQLTGFDGEGRPQLASRSVRDTVQVADGEEILIGGLKREAEVKTTRKVPFLGSLPIVGYWFGGEITTAKRTMVAVVLKPTVIKNYNTLQGSDADTVVAKVTGAQDAPLPDMEYGWDMFLMNNPKHD